MSSGTIRINGRTIPVVEKKLGRRSHAIGIDERQSLASRIDAIEERINRLTVSRRDPERFFIARSEIADDLRRMAQSIRG
jgi:hypothetical protein